MVAPAVCKASVVPLSALGPPVKVPVAVSFAAKVMSSVPILISPEGTAHVLFFEPLKQSAFRTFFVNYHRQIPNILLSINAG